MGNNTKSDQKINPLCRISTKQLKQKLQCQLSKLLLSLFSDFYLAIKH